MTFVCLTLHRPRAVSSKYQLFQLGLGTYDSSTILKPLYNVLEPLESG